MSYGGEEQRQGVPISPRLVIAVLIALFGIVSYYWNTQKNPVTGEMQHISMSVDQEKALGLQAAPEMADKMGGDISPNRDQRAEIVSEVGHRLVDRTEAAKSPYKGNFHFHLLNDPETINAFALPGGQIFITKALFDKLNDEAELAGVLGHEIGHVIHRHSAAQMAKGQLGNLLTMAVGVGASGGENSHARQAQMAAMMANQMLMLKYGRNDETQADDYGLKLMSESGFDPKAMLDVMTILKEASKGNRQPEFLSSHPLPRDPPPADRRGVEGKLRQPPLRLSQPRPLVPECPLALNSSEVFFMTTTIEVRDLPERFQEMLNLASAGGEVILTDGDVPKARLVPCNRPAPRVAGLNAGKFWMAPDFDDPLPDEFWFGKS